MQHSKKMHHQSEPTKMQHVHQSQTSFRIFWWGKRALDNFLTLSQMELSSSGIYTAVMNFLSPSEVGLSRITPTLHQNN